MDGDCGGGSRGEAGARCGADSLGRSGCESGTCGGAGSLGRSIRVAGGVARESGEGSAEGGSTVGEGSGPSAG